MLKISVKLETPDGKDVHEHTFYSPHLTLKEVRDQYLSPPHDSPIFFVRMPQGPYQQTIRFEEIA